MNNKELNKIYVLKDGSFFLLSEITAVIKDEDIFHNDVWRLSFKNGKEITLSDSDYMSLMTHMKIITDYYED